jgi:hypothetical protein
VLAIGILTLSLLSPIGTRPVQADTRFEILGRLVLTLREPQGRTQERAEAISQRFQALLKSGPIQSFQVTVKGDAQQAVVLVNDRMILDVTQADAEANRTQQVIALAELWAKRLQAVLDEPKVRDRLLITANLPEQVAIGGRRYVTQSEPVADRGFFITDGTRRQDRVIFWESPQRDRQFPSPPPAEIYLLDGSHRFIPYRAL